MAHVPKPHLAELHITGPARRDIAAIIRWSLEHFGEAASRRYESLIFQAFRDLQADPTRLGSKERSDLTVPGVRTYHLALSRAPGIGVKAPRHFVLYRQRRDGKVEIARILHDSRELARHLPENYKH